MFIRTMGKFLFLFIALFNLMAFAALAQTDTLRGKELRVVEIVGQPAERFAAGSRITTLDSTYLTVNNAGSLAEALQFRTPIYLKNYGSGMLATAAFRGTSASQTAVLWHGFNLNLPTLGQTDFSIIPTNSLSKVEVQHGSAGALYGTGAVGGAILLSSPRPTVSGFTWQAQQDIGSYRHYYSSLTGSFATKKISLQTAIYRNTSQNNFYYRNTVKAGHPTERQDNASLAQRGFTQNLDIKLNNQNTILARAWYTESENKIQPNLVAAYTQAQMTNKNLRLLSDWEHQSRLGTSVIKAVVFQDNMLYQDENINSEAKVTSYQTQAEHTLTIQEKTTFKVGYEGQLFKADVSGYGREFSEFRSSFFGLLRYKPLPVLDISANIRQGFVSGYNPPLTPSFGANVTILTNLHSTLIAKGAVNRGYRVPTLNDRFWPTSNPDLKPESSWNYESGLHYQFKNEPLTLNTEGTFYRLAVDNWIQWVPGQSGQWSPQNLKKVNSQGLEWSSEGSYDFGKIKLTGGGNYAYTITKRQKSYLPSTDPLQKQLIYVPLHTGSAYSSLHYKTWLAMLNSNITGYRYTNAENTHWLPSFIILNVVAGKNITWQKYQVQILAKINNIANQHYQTMEYYAMPLRNYSLSLRINFN